MKKKELLQRIEQLEKEVSDLRQMRVYPPRYLPNRLDQSVPWQPPVVKPEVGQNPIDWTWKVPRGAGDYGGQRDVHGLPVVICG